MRLLPIPAIKQSPSHCGPACLQMILAYYGKKVSERTLGKAAGTTLEHGTPPERLVAAAEAYGLAGTWKKRGTIEEIRALVEKGVPVIVNWFATDEGHYSVVVGVSDTHVTLNDPETGRRLRLNYETFRRVWFDFPPPWIVKPSNLRIHWMLPLTLK